MATFEWRNWQDGGEAWTGLLPVGEANNHALARIASIYRTSAGDYVGAYYFPHSTGNRQGSSCQVKTRRGAQRWIELQLARFWDPPTITNPIIGGAK